MIPDWKEKQTDGQRGTNSAPHESVTCIYIYVINLTSDLRNLTQGRYSECPEGRWIFTPNLKEGYLES